MENSFACALPVENLLLNAFSMTNLKEQESISLGDVARRAGVSKAPT